MKEENEIDKLFKSGLTNNYAFDEQLWKQVESQLPGAKKQRPFWHFNLNSIPLIITIIACAFLQTDTIKPLYAISQLSNEPIKEQQIDSDYSTTKSTLKITGNYIVSNDIETLKGESRQAENESEENTSTQKIIPSAQINLELNNTVDEKSTALKRLESNKKQLELQNQANNTSSQVFMNKLNRTSQLSELPNSEKKLQSILFIEPLGYSYSVLSLSSRPISAESDDKLNKLQEQLKPNYLYFELEAYRSVALNKKLKSNNQQFINYKKSAETPLYREGIGINIFRDIKRLNIGIGVHYNTYIERANYSYNEEQSSFESTYDTSYRLVNRNFSSNGNPVFLIEENINETITENTVITDKQLLVRNEFKRIQLPVIVGFKQNIGRWTAGVQTAFVFNYLILSRGIYIEENLNKFSNFNDNKQFNSLIYSQKNQVNLGYLLNEFVSIGSRFSYEYDINSFTKNYDSKFRSYNLGLWLQWRP